MLKAKVPPFDREMDPYVALARYSYWTYVLTGRVAGLPEGLPEEMLNRRSGAFVSLHENGDLRGCIGTIAATKENVAVEIVDNAVSACSRDPRFYSVEADELADIVCSVDVLGDAEPINSPDKLDPKRYGVIVRNGMRCGLLLPDLDGVDTADMQIAISKQKAGIRPNEPVTLERFEVIRHEAAQ